ncbi:MAG: DNA-3-methyladenine glycosylase I [Planctomycetes bacterium]|nr:DNA-3-methyladenine glycosylase I [Planctomycetota bacterium]
MTIAEQSHGVAASQSPTDCGTGDGRTRCGWVAEHPAHHAFHDAEWGMLPDDEAYARERLVLTCLQRTLPLADVLNSRDAIWNALAGCDFVKIASMDDDAIDRAASAGVPADRATLAFIRDVAAAGAETAKQCKDFREYLLAVRFLAREEQIADMVARFPGFTRIDAARLMENFGIGEGSSHERDCWRA